ncbi:aminomethyltransferase [Hathewaya proteolytica DSM 3090]|uniref:Aminomethyltransferase n=1 Tax=Hathewaya proteolytica DSM 3090 TaxID=1121331 RepID=A0A1M6SPU4_9CLOT|nr:glycine cleavage system aminomethyltransferase GcvT [Hathewaya proteolytica]SHK46676.1 aminomethyltransferase [Hathewaya proteolytica DSM 3090]
MDKKTPLYDCHVAAKGKLVSFAGYMLPVQYDTGVINEHVTVRERVGMFDVSHMAELVLSGKDALGNIQNLVTNDCSNLLDNQIKYSPMCYENGTVVDDLLVYRINETTYLLVVNAANHAKDAKWIAEHLQGDVKMEDISERVAQIALQGPKAKEVLKKICDEKELPEKYYTFTTRMQVAGKTCLVSQTGYTGEFGYEIYCASEDACTIWNALLENGQEEGLIPCGLGCRDTLRFEAGMPLYGHEMNDTIMPKEAGLGFAVKMKKENFIGKKAMEEKGDITRKLAGLKITGKGIAREHQDVFVGDKKVGFTTTGTHCPTLGGAYANAMLDLPYNEVGREVEIDVRGRRVKAEVVKTPFYKSEKK